MTNVEYGFATSSPGCFGHYSRESGGWSISQGLPRLAGTAGVESGRAGSSGWSSGLQAIVLPAPPQMNFRPRHSARHSGCGEPIPSRDG